MLTRNAETHTVQFTSSLRGVTSIADSTSFKVETEKGMRTRSGAAEAKAHRRGTWFQQLAFQYGMP
jgi:hypothetical protein